MYIEDGCPVGEACIWSAFCCSKEGSRGWFRCPCQSGVSLGTGFFHGWSFLFNNWQRRYSTRALVGAAIPLEGDHFFLCLTACYHCHFDLWNVAYGCFLSTWISFFFQSFWQEQPRRLPTRWKHIWHIFQRILEQSPGAFLATVRWSHGRESRIYHTHIDRMWAMKKTLVGWVI